MSRTRGRHCGSGGGSGVVSRLIFHLANTRIKKRKACLILMYTAKLVDGKGKVCLILVCHCVVVVSVCLSVCLSVCVCLTVSMSHRVCVSSVFTVCTGWRVKWCGLWRVYVVCLQGRRANRRITWTKREKHLQKPIHMSNTNRILTRTNRPQSWHDSHFQYK